MSKWKKFLYRWGPAILFMVVIFSFSSVPSAEMPNFGLMDFIIKKGGHALGYGLLALTYLRGLRGQHPRRSEFTQTMLIAWILSVLYSATDEFHQSFVPGRHPAITDVMIDSVGAAVALILAHKYLVKKSDQSKELITDN